MFETENNTNLERRIILRIVIGVLLAVFLYFYTAIFINYNEEVIVQSIISALVFGVFGRNVYKSKNFERCKHIFLVVSMLSGFTSFYYLGGLFGMVALDFMNIFLMISFLTKGKVRVIFIICQTLIVVLCGISQMFNIITVIDNSVGNPDWVNLLHILVRIGLSVNMGLALKNAYFSQYVSAQDLISKIKDLYADLAEQKEDLLSAQEQLTFNNNNLESIVAERTKTLEEQNDVLLTYAYINSHVFRAPICRIKGLKQLLEMSKDEAERQNYVNLISNEIASMDKVVSEIALMLNDSNPDFLEELKNKARKIGYQSD